MIRQDTEAHAHIILDGKNYKNAVSAHQTCVNRSIVRQRLAKYEKSGINFIRDGGDALNVSAYAKEIAEEYGIDYRTPIFAMHKIHHYGDIVGKAFSDIGEFRNLLDQAKRQGADFVKIMASGIVDFNDYGKVTCGRLTRSELDEIVNISHNEGFSVMVHANCADIVRDVVLSGADSVEHGYYLDDEAVGLLAESDCIWVPTTVTAANLIGAGLYADDNLKRIVRLHLSNIQKAVKAGANVAIGSDAGAFRVEHCEGLFDESRYFSSLDIETSVLDECLIYTQKILKDKFRRK